MFFFQLSCEYFKFEFGNHKRKKNIHVKKESMIFFMVLFPLVGFDETSKKNIVNEFSFSRPYYFFLVFFVVLYFGLDHVKI